MKVNVHLNDNDTVSYREDESYYFEESMSIKSDEEELCTINIMQTVSPNPFPSSW